MMIQFLRDFLRISSFTILFFTAWLLWPRELSSLYGYRDGLRLAPDYHMVNSRYVSVKNGKRELEAFSEDSKFDFIARKMEADDVTIYTYKDSVKQNKITAKHGTFFTDERYFILEGDVLNEALKERYFAKSDRVNYRVNSKLAETPALVEIWNEPRTLLMWGDRSKADLGSNVMWLYGNARAHFKEKRRGLTKIRGDEAELIGPEERANFYKNVTTEQEGIVGTSEEANLFYAPAAKNVRFLTLRTDVKIVEKGGRYTRSQVASFSAPTDTITLTGFPSVYDGDDAVSGDKITLYRGTGVVEVTSTNALGGSSARKPPGGKAAAKKKGPLSAEDRELLLEDDETTEGGKSKKEL
jgi:lipopolysaccharide export system protein LptA